MYCAVHFQNIEQWAEALRLLSLKGLGNCDRYWEIVRQRYDGLPAENVFHFVNNTIWRQLVQHYCERKRVCHRVNSVQSPARLLVSEAFTCWMATLITLVHIILYEHADYWSPVHFVRIFQHEDASGARWSWLLVYGQATSALSYRTFIVYENAKFE